MGKRLFYSAGKEMGEEIHLADSSEARENPGEIQSEN